MEELAKLPPWAMVTCGATIGLIFAARYLGLFQGQNASQSGSSSGAQVAAVIVDPTALNRAPDELAKLTEGLPRVVEIAEDIEKAQLGAARAVDGLSEELYIQRELGRRRN